MNHPQGLESDIVASACGPLATWKRSSRAPRFTTSCPPPPMPALASAAASLPYELWEAIITNVWRDTERGTVRGRRWHFYRAISLVCHQWRNIILRVRFKHVFFEDQWDFWIYNEMIGCYLSLYEGDLDSIDKYHQQMFSSCHLRVKVEGFADWKNIAPMEGAAASHLVASLISDLIPDAAAVDVAAEHLTPLLCRFLSSYHSVQRLRLSWQSPFEYLKDLPTCLSLAAPMRRCSITSLHIFQKPLELAPVLTSFRNVTHLHLTTPCFLGDLVVPLAHVQVLELDAPIRFFRATKKYARSIREWRIPSSLTSGLMQQSQRGKMRRGLIIVNTGTEEPEKWAEALDACMAHRIPLERRIIFFPSKK
ncbi:hypothetical protein JAAARDRAFT_217529 [Jaapia argillacea MUCL 33604]|uniref:F-box domain-containing protein n=1 Tax=Jaapia argillacea MUCL 33604 TaxID=933084 RepID=A0A067QAQ5_9AGAM|nr:hypothetical protein JAAARDRAFT_217529 [Jaapia argillacea MUCL 33604]